MAAKRWSRIPLGDEVTLISPEGFQFLLLNDLVHTMLDISLECSYRFQILFTEVEKLHTSGFWIFLASNESVSRWHTGKITVGELAEPKYQDFWKALDDWCDKIGVADSRIGQIGINIIMYSMGNPATRTCNLSNHLLMGYGKVQRIGISMGRFAGPPVKPPELPDFEPLSMTQEDYIEFCKSVIAEYMVNKLEPYIINGFDYVVERRERGKHIRLMAEFLRLKVGVNELSRRLTRDGLIDDSGKHRRKGFSKGNISTALTQLCQDMGINFPPSQPLKKVIHDINLNFGNSVHFDDGTVITFDNKLETYYKLTWKSMNLALNHIV